MGDEVNLGELWRHASTVLVDGWHLDARRCASTSLVAHGRSDDWVAVAIGPDGVELTARAPTPIEAIDALAASVSQGD